MRTVVRLVVLGGPALLLLATASPSLARATESHHSLRSAEAAFYRAKLPFSQDWAPHPANPYLVPAQPNEPRKVVPVGVRTRLIGWAGGANSKTFKSWQVFVFNDTSAAVTFARAQHARCKPATCHGVVIRANNVVYFGDRLHAALQALAELRRE